VRDAERLPDLAERKTSSYADTVPFVCRRQLPAGVDPLEKLVDTSRQRDHLTAGLDMRGFRHSFPRLPVSEQVCKRVIVDKPFHEAYSVLRMTRRRALTQLELIPATVSGHRGWVEARWQRADGSTGAVTARLRLKTAERWYISELLVWVPSNALLRDVPLARIEAAANADPKIREWLEQGTDEETVKRARRVAAERPRLKRPAGRRLDDDFFKCVAAAYLGAVANGLPPAKTLATDSDTPPGTVNRWIAEARDRGHLESTEPGKISVSHG
jgi:hypothetical protein